MQILFTLRPRIIGIVLALGLFLIRTSANAEMRSYAWIPALGLAVWVLNLISSSFIQAVNTDRATGREIRWQRIARTTDRLLEPLVAVLVMLGVLQEAPYLRSVDHRIMLVLILASIAAFFTALLFINIRNGHPIEIRSHWGGLGGGIGGWRISLPLICLLAAIGFGALAAIANMSGETPRQIAMPAPEK